MIAGWLGLDWGADTIYLAAACAVGGLLVLADLVLLAVRERTILGYLGWDEVDLDRPTEPLVEPPRDA